MPNQTQEPAAYVALKDLAASVQTPEDEAQLEVWRQEVDAERSAAVANLGRETVSFVQQDGVVVPQEVVDLARQEGQDVSLHSSGGRQS